MTAQRIEKAQSIKQRIISLIMMTSFTAIVLTTGAITVIGYFNLRASIAEELMVTASIVGDRNAAAILYDDQRGATENLRNVFSIKPNVLRVCLYAVNKPDSPFAVYGKDVSSPPQCPPPGGEDQVWFEGDHVSIMKRLYQDNSIYGTIFVQSSLRELEQYLQKQLGIALFVSIAALLIAFVLAHRLQRSLSTPILSLAATAQAISTDKDYSIRAKPYGDGEAYRDEISVLTDSFNEMLGEISAREQKLRRQNRELKEARDAAESANRAKSQFLANISHELRTPLNAIIGFSSILMNQLFGPVGDSKYLEYSRDINESGTHLLDIINDILDLAKAESGQLNLTYEEVHVGKIIQKCVKILAERAERGKVSVTTQLPEIMPALLADRLRLVQIVLNILSNAVKFTPETGRVTITVRTDAVEGETTAFHIIVADTGIGMRKEDMDKAFQSFGQVDGGLDRKYEGTGLGLPLTKKLMELHHGTLQMESELGKGTVVTLTFPAIPPANEDLLM